MRRPAQRIGRFVRPVPFHLGRVEDPAALRIEGIAAMHRCAIVPDHHITHGPPMLVAEPRIA